MPGRPWSLWNEKKSTPGGPCWRGQGGRRALPAWQPLPVAGSSLGACSPADLGVGLARWVLWEAWATASAQVGSEDRAAALGLAPWVSLAVPHVSCSPSHFSCHLAIAGCVLYDPFLKNAPLKIE